MSEVTQIRERCVVQIFTYQRVHRYENPRKCHAKGLYHVWRWRGGPKAPAGTFCLCGLMDEPPEDRN